MNYDAKHKLLLNFCEVLIKARITIWYSDQKNSRLWVDNYVRFAKTFLR